jgi:hypothetical protein
MLKLLRSFYGCALGLTVLASFSTASSQTTALARQLDRVDVAVSGIGAITEGVSGTNYISQPVTVNSSTTVGALVTARYTKSPLIGFEFNYSYARFNETYTGTLFSNNPPGSTSSTAGNTSFGVQSNVSEYTLGYVAHLPSLLGVQPFASVGAGATAFKPTPLGGQQLTEQARATYYYSVGVDDQLTRFFGVRAQLRQTFYKAPDFGQNYLTINQQTFTLEPGIGFYIKF